jgi:hypothetical protein
MDFFTTSLGRRKTAVFSPWGIRVCEINSRLFTAAVRTPDIGLMLYTGLGIEYIDNLLNANDL